MTHVEKYTFGKIVVDGREYHRDLIITPRRIIPNWWRRKGHDLSIEDLEEALTDGFSILVVGTGYHGFMNVSSKVIEELEKRGIKVIVENSREACKIFNRLSEKGEKVALAIHLTC
ncbi:MAG: hypothetical protein J7L38_00650 [Thermoproteales archaeon]|nr:hypothetical protein [Thermoproteales archaeon]